MLRRRRRLKTVSQQSLHIDCSLLGIGTIDGASI